MACGIFIGIRGNLGRLLLDSGVVDGTMSYNAICTARIILEGLVFQEPYKRVEPSKRPCEHKTLESNKSHLGYHVVLSHTFLAAKSRVLHTSVFPHSPDMTCLSSRSQSACGMAGGRRRDVLTLTPDAPRPGKRRPTWPAPTAPAPVTYRPPCASPGAAARLPRPD